MLTRTALILTVLAALGQPATARPASSDPAPRRAIAERAQVQTALPRPATTGTTAVILPPANDDIRAGREPRLHASAIRQITIDEAVGNVDRAEILKAQLRGLGASGDAVSDAVTWTKVHESRPVSAPRRPAFQGVHEESAPHSMY